MASLVDVYARVRPDTDNFGPELKRKLARIDADRPGRDMGRKMGAGMGAGMASMARRAATGFAAAFAAVKVGGFLKGTVTAASDLNETVSKTKVVFGPAAAAVLKFSQGTAKSLGQSRQAALDASATFGVFGKSAGLQGPALAQFSTQMTTLASDMASFSNTSPEEAIVALGAALRGENEPIRRYGVLLDDATLRGQAMRMGLIKTTKEALTPQQKVLAAHAVILQQTKDAQGDFARTSGGLANQQRILSARFDDLKGRIGQVLLPIITRAVTKFNEWLPTIERLGGQFARNMLPRLRDVGEVISQRVLPIIRDIGGFITDKLVPAVQKFAQNALPNLRRAFGNAGATLRENRGLLEGIGQVVTFLVEKVLPLLGTVWGYQVRAVIGVIRVLLTAVRWNFNFIGRIIETFIGAVEGVVRFAAKIPGPWQDSMRKLANSLDTAKGNIRRFRDEINRVPTTKSLKVTTTNTETAARTVRNFRDSANLYLSQIRSRAVNITTRAQIPAGVSIRALMEGRATGGAIRGPGTGTSDTAGVYRLSNNEHVWTAREVAAAGGHAAVENIRRAVLSGGLGAMAAGGPVTRGPILHNRSEGLGDLRTFSSAFDRGIGRFASRIGNSLLKLLQRVMGPVGPGGWAFPLPRGSYRVGGGINSYPGHTGQDFPAPRGTPVFAPFAGMFTPVRLGNRSYGNYANITAGQWRSIQAHLLGFARGAGAVRAGELVGYVDSTGNSTGNHLHQEFRRNGQIVSPRSVLKFDRGGWLMPGLNPPIYNGTGRPERVLPPGGGDTYIINAPHYVGDKNDLVRALDQLKRDRRF